MANEFYQGSAIAIGTDIYLFGSSVNDYRTYTYKMLLIKTKDKTIFIEVKQLFKIKLTKTIETYISDAKISTDKELLEYPVYYGNGQEWINIKTLKPTKSIITEQGREIETEDNKIIEIEGE